MVSGTAPRDGGPPDAERDGDAMADELEQHSPESDGSGGMTRRRFLSLAQMVGAGAAAVAAGVLPLESLVSAEGGQPGGAETKVKHDWVMVIDQRKCDGCKKCTEACQKMHYLTGDQQWIRVYETESAAGQKSFLPRPCMMCENPPCLRVCPVGATFQDDEGMVLIDQNRCIGCRMCLAACPYEGRTFNWNDPPQPPAAVAAKGTPEYPVPQVKGTAGKCVFCVHNLRAGKLPACVDTCSMNALYVGDRKTDLASNREETVKLSAFLKENNAYRLKEELNTQPRVYYIPGHGELLEY